MAVKTVAECDKVTKGTFRFAVKTKNLSGVLYLKKGATDKKVKEGGKFKLKLQAVLVKE